MVQYKIIDKKISTKEVHRALRSWHNLSGSKNSMLENMMIVQQMRNEFQGDQNVADHRKITNQILKEGIEILRERDNECAEILLRRFINDMTIVAVSIKLDLSQDQVNRRQREGIELLTEILLSKESKIREQRAEYQYSRLDIKVSEEIFGNKKVLEQVSEKLLSFGESEILVITGIGGIGKTTIANAVAKEAIANFRFNGLLWIRADANSSWMKNDEFSEKMFFQHLANRLGIKNNTQENISFVVREHLAKYPHLLIVDNISTEDDLDSLIKTIKGIANPSKFIITSRRKPRPDSDVFVMVVPELSKENARELLISQTKKIEHKEIAEELVENLDEIYSIVGGIPLALKLFVGLLDILPLSIVLKEMREVNFSDVDSMYKHIYWRSWNVLSKSAKDILIGMIQSSELGVTFDNILAFSQKDRKRCISALNELTVRSLMDWQGDIENRRYGIHQLTMTFLQMDIVEWPLK